MGEAITPVSKKKTSLDTKNQEESVHLKDCQQHQYLIYNAKVKRLRGRQNPRGNYNLCAAKPRLGTSHPVLPAYALGFLKLGL